MDNKIFDKAAEWMKKSLEVLRSELSTMRTGRASLSMLDEIRVEYYGTQTPLNQLATLSLPDARTIAIQPWDASAASAIEKALQKSDLGFNPVNDGKVVRVHIPALNEERRKDLVKTAHKYAEECKVSVRNTRRECNEELKALKKTTTLTEDEERKGTERIQKMTDDCIKQIDDTLSHKEKDIMQV